MKRHNMLSGDSMPSWVAWLVLVLLAVNILRSCLEHG